MFDLLVRVHVPFGTGVPRIISIPSMRSAYNYVTAYSLSFLLTSSVMIVLIFNLLYLYNYSTAKGCII